MVQNFQNFFKSFADQSKSFYTGLTRGRKIALLLSGLAVLVLLVGLAALRPRLEMETVYTGLSQEDKTAILAYLRKNNITEFNIEGDSLIVSPEKALDVRMRLAEEGLPNSGAGVGWEKFDDRAFGMTDFDQRVNKLRAVQGEISRTINKLEPVQTSRVHIVMPDASVFADDKKPTTASIYLRLKNGKSLSQRQIQGVLHLTAKAVEGLDIQNIAIVDQAGNMLTKPEEDDGGLDKVTSTQREFQKRVEKEMESKIGDILQRVVGHNKVVAKVQADIDFKKVETTIQDVDPDRTAVVAQNRSEQSSAGAGTNPTGVPGAKSNLPGEKEDAATGGGSSTSSKQSNETVNYEVKKTFSKIIEPVGTIKKITTAVLVDGKIVDGKPTARSAEEIAMITKLVKNTIGMVDERDSITVETAQFELDENAILEKETSDARKASLIQTGIISVVALLAMLFIYYALLRPYFRWLTFDPEKRSREDFVVEDYELERSGAAAKRVAVQEDIPFDKLTPKEQIMYLAKHDPKKTTEALRRLLSPSHG
jgi:flagellar M-ring protein FliF